MPPASQRALPRAHVPGGRTARRAGHDGAAAAQIYERAPHSTDGLLLMGAIYYHLGNYAQSVRCNDACLLLDATIAEAHANLANSLQQLGHLATATAYYQARRRRFGQLRIARA